MWFEGHFYGDCGGFVLRLSLAIIALSFAIRRILMIYFAQQIVTSGE